MLSPEQCAEPTRLALESFARIAARRGAESFADPLLPRALRLQAAIAPLDADAAGRPDWRLRRWVIRTHRAAEALRRCGSISSDQARDVVRHLVTVATDHRLGMDVVFEWIDRTEIHRDFAISMLDALYALCEAMSVAEMSGDRAGRAVAVRMLGFRACVMLGAAIRPWCSVPLIDALELHVVSPGLMPTRCLPGECRCEKNGNGCPERVL